jgi:FixJ family two-component response regulator
MAGSAPVVFIVDDDEDMRTVLTLLVSSVGYRSEAFASAEEFLAAARPDGPACLVLDVQMPGRSGLDLQREMAAAELELPIIFITGHGDIRMSVQAMKAGAVEFLPKPFRNQDLLDAIRAAVERDREARRLRAGDAALRERFERLTPREREVMALVVRGLLNKQIAGELGTSERTVKAHRAQVMKKMAAGSLAELIRMAERVGTATTER